MVYLFDHCKWWTSVSIFLIQKFIVRQHLLWKGQFCAGWADWRHQPFQKHHIYEISLSETFILRQSLSFLTCSNAPECIWTTCTVWVADIKIKIVAMKDWGDDLQDRCCVLSHCSSTIPFPPHARPPWVPPTGCEPRDVRWPSRAVHTSTRYLLTTGRAALHG